MTFKLGQQVRDAANPDRIGIVVGTGSTLGARVLWCGDESLTWTSERAVVRAPEDVLSNPVPGDRMEWRSETWTVSSVVMQVVIRADDGVIRTNMSPEAWRDPGDIMHYPPFTCVPVQVPQ
jgi:hypothetical protein